MKSSRWIWISAALTLGLVAVGRQARVSARSSGNMMAVNPRLVEHGRRIVADQRCNTCHAANLAGKPHFSPSLRRTGVLRHYNERTFARVMNSGITDDGKKVHKPMPTYHMKAADSAALYAYLRTLR